MEIKKIKILIVGSGGREHAVGWRLKDSSRAGELFFAPGNGGTATLGTNVPIDPKNILELLRFVKENSIDLTLALPDDPLVLGIVDEFKNAGLRIWGPTKIAAELEWSKAYSKSFMDRHNLPTAKFKTFNNIEEASKYIETEMLPIVIKASGLALGKGVIICETKEEANTALENIFIKKIFGEAGNEVVIEEFLVGPEISIHAFSDGTNFALFPPSQDHKRVGEGNTGPNTGGMGTIAPLSIVSEGLMKKINDDILTPTFSALNTEGRTFQGVLYPGLILTKEGPKILEYNARLGDPETQTYMRLLDTDLLDIFEACIDGTLHNTNIRWRDLFACNIVLASGGYPGEYQRGKIISGVEEVEKLPDIVVFHAGTKWTEAEGPEQERRKNLITNGGRVLGISATGKTLEEALAKAYKAIEKISFDGMQYRRDIGKASISN